MNKENSTAVEQSLKLNQLVKAEVITASSIPHTYVRAQDVRTVATSLTTGSVSIRYVPRMAKLVTNTDTSAD